MAKTASSSTISAGKQNSQVNEPSSQGWTNQPFPDPGRSQVRVRKAAIALLCRVSYLSPAIESARTRAQARLEYVVPGAANASLVYSVAAAKVDLPLLILGLLRSKE
jgi:hypothetical protein